MSPSSSSLTRAQAARIRDLFRKRRARQTEGAFIVEGASAVRDVLLTHPTHIQQLVVSARYGQREQDRDRFVRESARSPTYTCSDSLFDTLSELEAPQGILAVVRQPRWNERDLFVQPVVFGLYGEDIQDPINVGAIIRTAAALNVSALWLTSESADMYNPKVVRGTSGALLSLPIFTANDGTRFIEEHCSIFAAEAQNRGAVPMETIERVPSRLILAVGNESRGLSARTLKQASRRFRIPLARRIESLNVAATAAIALFYLGRLPKTS